MGNWRRAMIEGTCAADEVDALREAVEYDLTDLPAADHPFTPLTAAGGLMGLPSWPAEEILAVGNMAERGYGPEDVADALELYAGVAPSLAVKVHVGGDHEADECVATVTLENGEVAVGEPERDRLPEVSGEQVRGQMFGALTRRSPG